MKNKWYEVLESSLLFSDMSKENILNMVACLNPKEKSYTKGEIVAHLGEKMEGFGLLLQGSLSVLKENIDGNRLIMNILKPGELFGEMAVYSEKRVWPATISAVESSIVLFIKPEKIVAGCERACSYHQQLTTNMLKILSDKAMSLNKQVEYLSIKGMREKLCTYIWEQHKKQGSLLIHLPMKRNKMADFLNVSRPSMSRELCKMRDEGLIDFYLSTVKIVDPQQIAEYVK